MPLYIAKSGDLDRCYRCLTDGQTLKDSATQLLIKYKRGALVTKLNATDIETLLGRLSLQIYSMSGENKKPKKLKLSVMDFGNF